MLPPPLRSTLVDSPGLRIGGGVASGRVGGWPARTNPWAGGRVLGADAALQGGVCSVAGFWWDNAGPPGPAGSWDGKVLREVALHLYWTLHWGAHMEDFRAPTTTRTSSEILVHPV